VAIGRRRRPARETIGDGTRQPPRRRELDRGRDHQSSRADLNEQVRDVLDDELGGNAGPDLDEDDLKAQLQSRYSTDDEEVCGGEGGGELLATLLA